MFRKIIGGLFAFLVLVLLVGCEHKSILHNGSVYWILTHNNLSERAFLADVKNPFILKETDTLLTFEDYLQNGRICTHYSTPCGGALMNSHEEAPLGPLDYISVEDLPSKNRSYKHIEVPYDIGSALSAGNIHKLKYVGSIVSSKKFNTSIFEGLFEGGSNYYLINHKKNRIISCAFLGSLTVLVDRKGEFDGYIYYYTTLDGGLFRLWYYGKTGSIEDAILAKSEDKMINNSESVYLYNNLREAYINDKEMKAIPTEIASYCICESGEIKVKRLQI